MSQIVTSFIESLAITNLTGATDHALVVGAADGSLTSLGVAGNGVLPIGSIGADPVLATLTAGTNINIANNPGNITISAIGGGIGPEFEDDVFRVVDNADNTAKLAFECDQITTGTERIITMCDQDLSFINPSFPGDVTCGTGLTVTTGDLEVSAGNLGIPDTNAAFTQGIFTMGGSLFMHNLGVNNTFLGYLAGSAINNGTNNTSIGSNSLENIDDGTFNTFVGSSAGLNIRDGSLNVGIGAPALSFLTTGELNVVLGAGSGINYTSSESSNILISNDGVIGDDNVIRIGTQGSGAGEQDNCFIAGIYGNTVATPSMVVIDSNGELGTTSISPINEFQDSDFRIYDNGDNTKKIAFEASAISAGTVRTITMDDRDIDMDAVATTYSTDSTDATAAAGTITIAGSGAVSTSGAGSTVTIASTSLVWNEVTGTSQAAAVNNGYITNNAGLVTVTLPSTAAVGSVVRVAGLGAGGWSIAQNASQYIRMNESEVTTTGVGGSMSSTDDYDAIELLCVVANNGWSVVNAKGNISYV